MEISIADQALTLLLPKQWIILLCSSRILTPFSPVTPILLVRWNSWLRLSAQAEKGTIERKERTQNQLCGLTRYNLAIQGTSHWCQHTACILRLYTSLVLTISRYCSAQKLDFKILLNCNFQVNSLKMRVTWGSLFREIIIATTSVALAKKAISKSITLMKPLMWNNRYCSRGWSGPADASHMICSFLAQGNSLLLALMTQRSGILWKLHISWGQGHEI